MGIPITKIRRSRDRLIFMMGTHILVRRYIHIKTAPGSVPSVCCHTFFTMFLSSYHHEIFRLTIDKSGVHAKPKGQGQWSRSQRSKQIFGPVWVFRAVTPIWFCRWLRNDEQNLKGHTCRRGALLFFKVICQMPMSHGAKNRQFDPNWAFPDCS